MTNEKAIEMMKAKLECMTRSISGVDQDCNMNKCFECDLCYAQGNMGEQKEWLRMGIESLENQKTGHWIEKNVNQDGTHNIYCSNCNNYLKFKGHANSYNAKNKLKYCPKCGAKME